MTELSTRGFISQWPYYRSQDRDDLQDTTISQLLGMERVAGLMRQREEHHLGLDSDPMDLEARAAALEAHFFPAHQQASPGSDIKSSNHARNSGRVRPQSASLARRKDAMGASSHEVSAQPRPQSAKTRTEATKANKAAEGKYNVARKFLRDEKASKWREMLARGPEFKQLSLRRLELETYELLYNTLQQPQVVETKSTRRRRRRRGSGSTSGRTNHSDNPAVACGSGLHLARSRKKQQQEHDQRMMLGKTQRIPQNTGTQQRGEPKRSEEDKRTIQEKTRKRSKLLKHKSQKQLQEKSLKRHGSRHDIQQQRQEPSSERLPNGVRAPWIPSGSSKSLDIRGIIVLESSEQSSQEKRITQVLDAFNNHAETHMRITKQVYKVMKKSKESKPFMQAKPNGKTEPRPASKKHSARSKQRLGAQSASKVLTQASAGSIDSNNPLHQSSGDQEIGWRESFDLRQAPSPQSVLSGPPMYGNESWSSLTPVTPVLVIPPLVLPTGSLIESEPAAALWEDQQLSDTCNDDENNTALIVSDASPCNRESNVHNTEAVEEPKSDVCKSIQDTADRPNQELRIEASAKPVSISAWTTEENKAITASDVQVVSMYPEPLRIQECVQEQESLESASRRHYMAANEHYVEERCVELGNDSPPTEDLPAECQQESDKDDKWHNVDVNRVDEATSAVNHDAVALSTPPLGQQNSSRNADFRVDRQLESIVLGADDPVVSMEDSVLSTTTALAVDSPLSGEEKKFADTMKNTASKRKSSGLTEKEVGTVDNGKLPDLCRSEGDTEIFDLRRDEPNNGNSSNDDEANESREHFGGEDGTDRIGGDMFGAPLRTTDGGNSSHVEVSGENEQNAIRVGHVDTLESDFSLKKHQNADAISETNSPSILSIETVSCVKYVHGAVTNDFQPLEHAQRALGESTISIVQDLVPHVHCDNDRQSATLKTSDYWDACIAVENRGSLLSTSTDDLGIATESKLLSLQSGNHGGVLNDSVALPDEPMQVKTTKPASVSGDDANVDVASDVEHTQRRSGLAYVSANLETQSDHDTFPGEGTVLPVSKRYSSDLLIEATDVFALPCSQSSDRGDTTSQEHPCTMSNSKSIGASESVCKMESTTEKSNILNTFAQQSAAIGSIGLVERTPTEVCGLLAEASSNSVDDALAHFTSTSKQTVKTKMYTKQDKKRKQPKASAADAGSVPSSEKRKTKKDKGTSGVKNAAVENTSLATDPNHFLSSRSSGKDIEQCNSGPAEEQFLLVRQATTRSFLMRVAGVSTESEAKTRKTECSDYQVQSLDIPALEAEHEDKVGNLTVEVAPAIRSADKETSATVAVEATEDTQLLLLLHGMDGMPDHNVDVEECEHEEANISASIQIPEQLTQSPSECNTGTEPQSQDTFTAVPHREEGIKTAPSVVTEDNSWIASTVQDDDEIGSGKVEWSSPRQKGQDAEREDNHASRFAAEQRHENPLQEPPRPEMIPTELDCIWPPSEPVAKEVVKQDFVERHDIATRQIQAQYRCFVRRRMILDQLRFMVAKHRRQARRKARQKPKKTKDVADTVASGSDESPLAAVGLDSTKVGDVSTEVKQVTPISAIAEVDVNAPPEVPVSFVAEPVVNVDMSMARKDSCDYDLDLFDGSRGVIEEQVTTIAVDSVTVEEMPQGWVEEQGPDHRVDPQMLDEKAAAPHDTNADSHGAFVRQEEDIPFEQPAVAVRSAIDLEFGFQEPTTPVAERGPFNALMLAELAFSDDIDDNKAEAVTDACVTTDTEAITESQWERYVDSTTSKSWYFNRSTSESQWTTPEDGSIVDKAKPSSPHAASTTPQAATTVVAATDIATVPQEEPKPTQEPLGTWQEFLDEASGQLFYYNTKTGESSWAPPAEASIDRFGVVASPESAATAAASAAGAASSSGGGGGGAWVMHIDPASQAPYYMNVETLATSWEQPAEFAMRSSLLTSLSEPNVAATVAAAPADEQEYIMAI